jgi:hypothetical protein
MQNHKHNKKYQVGDQWLIDTQYTRYKEFLPFLDRDSSEDYGRETVAQHASQYPLWHDPDQSVMLAYPKKYGGDFEAHPLWHTVADGAYEWTNRKLKENGIEVEIRPVISWYIDYKEGGWQPMHTHSKNCVTQIIYMDAQTHSIKVNEANVPEFDGKEAQWGSMFALMASKDETKYMSFMNWPGRCVLMRGDIFHGVYPVKSVPRRSIIIDYIILT